MDDEYSSDHHWGIRVNAVMPDALYHDRGRTIAQAVLPHLPESYHGYDVRAGFSGGTGLSITGLESYLKTHHRHRPRAGELCRLAGRARRGHHPHRQRRGLARRSGALLAHPHGAARLLSRSRCGCAASRIGAAIFPAWAAMRSSAPSCATTSTMPRSSFHAPCAGPCSLPSCWSSSTIPTTSGPMPSSSACRGSTHRWRRWSTRPCACPRRGNASWNCSTAWPT